MYDAAAASPASEQNPTDNVSSLLKKQRVNLCDLTRRVSAENLRVITVGGEVPGRQGYGTSAPCALHFPTALREQE